MPISNPVLKDFTVNQYITLGTDLTLSNADPSDAPTSIKKFWFNYTNQNLFLAIATNSPADWVAIGGANNEIDVSSILNKILVQNGQVLTTDDHVIFED
jgi:hypothetical protein